MIYAGVLPQGGTELGVVEVHGVQEDARVDVLLPQLVRRRRSSAATRS